MYIYVSVCIYTHILSSTDSNSHHLQARRVAADANSALRCGQLRPSEAHRVELRSVAFIGKLLLALIPRAEAQVYISIDIYIHLVLDIYIYICICMYVCMCMYIYV